MQSWSRPNVPQVPGQPPVMRLFDTSSGAIEEVKTTDRASIYVCGITPYDATHLGHASTLSLIHISEPTRRLRGSRMPSSA